MADGNGAGRPAFPGSFLEILVVSNIFTAVFTLVVCLITFYLTAHPVVFLLPLTVFSGTLFIYTMNRFTDRREDSINNPRRLRYIDRYGKATFIIAAGLYCASLAWLLLTDIPSFLVALLPLVLAVLYSVFRLKRVFLAKNIVVASGALCSVALVLVYFRDITPYSVMLSLFFFLGFLTNTIIYDIKDIRGDLQYRIATIPAVYGVQVTKILCFALLLSDGLLVPALASWNPAAGLLILYTLYLGIYTAFAGDPEKLPSWYYGIFVEGECLFLGACFGIAMLLGR